jgi:hypothetical protein
MRKTLIEKNAPIGRSRRLHLNEWMGISRRVDRHQVHQHVLEGN